jgi:hypothetical protein
VGVAVLLLLGLFARAASIANLLLLIFFFGLRGFVAPHAADWILHAMGFCLVLMTSDRYLSVRHLVRDAGRAGEAEALPGWPLRVAQLSYAGVFLTAGLSKLPDPTWRNGSAFPTALFNPLVTRLDLTWLESYAGALAVVGVGVLAWELAYPFLLWNRRVRPWAIMTGLAFLLGVDLTLRVGWFTWGGIVFTAVFFDELFPKSRTRRGGERSVPLSIPVHAFLLFHSWAFGLAIVGYAAVGLGARPLGAPVLSEYARYVAGVHYYNVWPTAYVANPVRMVTYDARMLSGEIRPVPPFDAAGALRLGFFSREVREGLLGLRVEAAGMKLSGWERYAEYVADRYARTYDGDCPAEIRFHGIRAPLSEFGGRPKDLRVARTLLATATFECPDPRVKHVALEAS